METREQHLTAQFDTSENRWYVHRAVDGKRLYGPYASEEQAQQKINYVITGQANPTPSDEKLTQKLLRLASQKTSVYGYILFGGNLLGISVGGWAMPVANAVSAIAGVILYWYDEQRANQVKE